MDWGPWSPSRASARLVCTSWQRIVCVRYNITLKDLKLANKLWTNEGIWPGRRLKIPVIEVKYIHRKLFLSCTFLYQLVTGSLDLSVGSSTGSDTMSTDSQLASAESSSSSRRVSSTDLNSSRRVSSTDLNQPLQPRYWRKDYSCPLSIVLFKFKKASIRLKPFYRLAPVNIFQYWK